MWTKGRSYRMEDFDPRLVEYVNRATDPKDIEFTNTDVVQSLTKRDLDDYKKRLGEASSTPMDAIRWSRLSASLGACLSAKDIKQYNDAVFVCKGRHRQRGDINVAQNVIERLEIKALDRTARDIERISGRKEKQAASTVYKRVKHIESGRKGRIISSTLMGSTKDAMFNIKFDDEIEDGEESYKTWSFSKSSSLTGTTTHANIGIKKSVPIPNTPLSGDILLEDEFEKTSFKETGQQQYKLKDVIILCDVCDEKEGRKCSQCKAAYYCGRECQLQVWRSHKKECKKLSRNLGKAESRPIVFESGASGLSRLVDS